MQQRCGNVIAKRGAIEYPQMVAGDAHPMQKFRHRRGRIPGEETEGKREGVRQLANWKNASVDLEDPVSFFRLGGSGVKRTEEGLRNFGKLENRRLQLAEDKGGAQVQQG